MTTTSVPDSVPTPGSPLAVSRDHLIPPSSLRIACGLRYRKWCHHVGRVDPLRRRAIPCSAMQKPPPRSLIPRSWLSSRSHQRTSYSSMSYFLANIHLTFPGNLRPLSSISTVHLDPEDHIESDNESLLSFELNYCPCGNSMHVHDSVDEEGEFGDDESVDTFGSVDTNVVETQRAQAKVVKCKSDSVNTAKEIKAELVQCDKMWYVDAHLEAVVGVAAKVDVVKCKNVWVDAYLKAIGDAAAAATEVIHVYFSPTPPGPPPRVDGHPGFPSLLTQPVNVALRPPNSFVVYPSPSVPHQFHQQASHSSTSVNNPGLFVQTPQLQPQASHPSVFVGRAGSTVQAFQYQPQADLSFSSLSPEDGSSRDSILGIAYDSNSSRDSILGIPFGSDSSRDSIHSYTSGFTAGYVADADTQSEVPSSSLSPFQTSSSITGSIAPPDVTSQPVLDRTPHPRESKKGEPWFNVRGPTFRSHVLSSLPPTREPSPVRASPVYIDTFPSSRGLRVMSRQPSNAHPSLNPDLTTVYELRNGLGDKRKWKRTKSRGLWRRRFINMIVSWFGGYQNADPIDELPSRDKSKGWLGALRNPPKHADTPMPSVVGTELNQSASSPSKETATASSSLKEGSKSGLSFWGLFKKKNKDKKLDMGKGMSTDSSSPHFPSSGLSAASSLRVPVAARSFQGPTTSLYRSMPTTAAKEEDRPMSAMELSARLSALMPDKSCPPVQQVQRQVSVVFQYYDAGTGITFASATPQQVPSLLASVPATPQWIFNTLSNAMAAPPPVVKETARRSSTESFYADLNELIAHSEASNGTGVTTSPEAALTTPVLQPVAPPVPDVPALLLEPAPVPSSAEPLDLNPACKLKHDGSNNNNNNDEDNPPKGAAQVDKAEGKKRLDYWDSDSDEHTAEYWLNAYTSYPTPIHKGRSLVRSLRTYHPRNRNSRLEVPTLPALLLVSDDEDEDTNKNSNKSNDGNNDELYDGGNVFDAGSTVCATNKSYAKKAPKDETWRSFGPGQRPLTTIHEGREDEKNEGGGEHSLLASSSNGTGSFYGDQHQEEKEKEEKEEERGLTDAEEAVLDELYRFYGSEIVSGALWTAYEAGHAPTLQELVDELGKLDLDMFWKGQALPEPNRAPGPRRGFGKEDDGAGVGVGGCMSQPPETRDREYHVRKGSFRVRGDEGLEKHWTV